MWRRLARGCFYAVMLSEGISKRLKRPSADPSSVFPISNTRPSGLRGVTQGLGRGSSDGVE
ncbi:hypothetical protein L209DRAFT_750742 [Thermothelomyces heterothallicus CBS 203.75]